MYWLSLIMTAALAATLAPASQKPGESRRPTAPETFNGTVQVSGEAGAAATSITIKLQQYSTDADRLAAEQALKGGGQDALIAALGKAPVAGTLTISGRSFEIRYARQERLPNGRTIVLVTDKPVYFAGGGSVDAKPREGYAVALLKFRMDDSGMGYNGTMAAAAKVKIGAGGVEVEDYAGKLFEIKTITRDLRY
jgi:hypothetical protein